MTSCISVNTNSCLKNNDLQTTFISGVIGEVSLVMFLVVAAFGGLAFLIWKMVPQVDRDNISVGTVSTLSRSSIFGSRNRDRFTDQSSIYSITLSEKDDGFIKKPNEGDNTSEA